MWIKSLNFGYINTDHIQKIRLRPAENKYGDAIAGMFAVSADLSDGAFYILTEGVTKEKAEELLRIIMQEVSVVLMPGTFQVPYDPPTE